jgi:intracellular septation protein
MSKNLRTLLLGGLLPVILFTVIEESFGIIWGLIAGMAASLFEVAWEWKKQGKVDAITWVGSGAMLALGGISLATQEGVWFRLQPALLEGMMGLALVGSVLAGKPFLNAMAKKQGTLSQIPPEALPFFEGRLKGLTFRVGLFFLAHAVLATWAALYWSVRAWAVLKGVGFTVSFFAYLGVEMWLMRRGRPAAPPAPETPPVSR